MKLNTMRVLSRFPIIGPFLAELLLPSRVAYRRFGDKEDRERRLKAQGLVLFTVVTGIAYLAWVFSVINWAHPVIGGLFIGAESVCFILFLLAGAGAWRLRFKPQETPLVARPTSIDVLITVCGEPITIVSRTVAAAARIEWDGPLHLYVLDDGGSPEVEALARRHGATYRSRMREGHLLKDAKAGNLNFGLNLSHGEYVLTLDADQVPVPSILSRLAPYLTLPKVAFVQSKQSFLVPSDDPFYCQDLVFYDTLQPAFDANDTVLSCGSGVLYRRAALNDIGGFVTWNLVEDLTTSYELHCRGWKSLYYPYALAEGLAPHTVAGVYRQRGQWALDTMRLFFWRNPLTRKTLPWARRLNYFVIGFSYLTAGFVAPLFYAIPVWSYLTGQSVLTGREIDFALWRTLYFLTMTLAMRWLFRGHQPGKQFQMLVGLFPVYMMNSIRALRYRIRKPGYYVNNVVRRRRAMPALVLLLPQMLLLAANVLGPFYALMTGSATPRLIAANICVSALAIWSLSHVCATAFHRPRWQAERNPVHFYAATV
jgi:cellulose synthase (UDP-forming)